ncbi:MAG: tRNA-modifying protein YgfZ [Gammaproteobacteria bacterium]
MQNKIPEVFPQTSGKFLPHDLGLVNLEAAINFKKGCYRGQEIIARMQYRGNLKKRLNLLENSNNFKPGENIHTDSIVHASSQNILILTLI